MRVLLVVALAVVAALLLTRHQTPEAVTPVRGPLPASCVNVDPGIWRCPAVAP